MCADHAEGGGIQVKQVFRPYERAMLVKTELALFATNWWGG